MFLPRYSLFLVECKSNHPFFGHHSHRALSEPWKRESSIPWVAESKDQSSAPNTTRRLARSSVCLLKSMVFPRKCVVTSGVIYPGRGGLGMEVVGAIQTETQTIPEHLKFKVYAPASRLLQLPHRLL